MSGSAKAGTIAVAGKSMELTGKNEGKFKGKGTTTSGGESPEIKMIREKVVRT